MIGSFSQSVTEWTGSSLAFFIALGIVIIWAVTGPIFHYSNTWQLVINTGTTIITFLMVFLIQRAQNKDSLALQLKLNELVAAMEGASNRLIDVEHMSEKDLKLLRSHYRRLVEMSVEDGDLVHSHSVEEAERRHLKKHRNHPKRRSEDESSKRS
ncbi:MAG: low affinity iron permease family protein [Acidobacteriota bacterium]